MQTIIPIIDLFAGPGGLSEGFSRFSLPGRPACRPFKVVTSIEKDKWAHRTLELRSFYRQFSPHGAPEEYYRYLRSETTRDQLFETWPAQALAARSEARLAELGGVDDTAITEWIDTALKAYPGASTVLIGGPPCQAYSVIGRSRMSRQADFEQDKRHFLYKEYLRIILQVRPAAFIMENVKGLLSSKIDGLPMFTRILSDLKHPGAALRAGSRVGGLAAGNDDGLGYNVHSLSVPAEDPATLQPRDFVIKAEEYGVPQARHRLVLVGVRNDLHATPRQLIRATQAVHTCAVLDDLPKLRSKISNRGSCVHDSDEAWRQVMLSALARDWTSAVNHAQYDLFSDAVVEHMACSVSEIDVKLTSGDEFVACEANPMYEPAWYNHRPFGGVCNHQTRSHIPADLHRYLYAACFAAIRGNSPRMRDFPLELLPAHKNVKRNNDRAFNQDFDDRFRVQVANRPATTVTAHISKDGHYHIHYDPRQCRSLTVREAARLQTFPDDYFFEGPRTQQYKQVGNAVPPLLAYQIAGAVHALLSEENDLNG